MNDEQIKPDFTPPRENELPQGARAFLQALEASYKAVEELFAPYLQHPGLGRNFDNVLVKLREAGMWVNDSLNMIQHPELFRLAEPKEEGDGSPEESN